MAVKLFSLLLLFIMSNVSFADGFEKFRYGSTQFSQATPATEEIIELSKYYYNTCGWVGFQYQLDPQNNAQFDLRYGEGAGTIVDIPGYDGSARHLGQGQYQMGTQQINRKNLVCNYMCYRKGAGIKDVKRDPKYVLSCYSEESETALTLLSRLEEWMYGSPTQTVNGKQKRVTGWDINLLLSSFTNKNLEMSELVKLIELYSRKVDGHEQFYGEVRSYFDLTVFKLKKHLTNDTIAALQKLKTQPVTEGQVQDLRDKAIDLILSVQQGELKDEGDERKAQGSNTQSIHENNPPNIPKQKLSRSSLLFEEQQDGYRAGVKFTKIAFNDSDSQSWRYGKTMGMTELKFANNVQTLTRVPYNKAELTLTLVGLPEEPKNQTHLITTYRYFDWNTNKSNINLVTITRVPNPTNKFHLKDFSEYDQVDVAVVFTDGDSEYSPDSNIICKETQSSNLELLTESLKEKGGCWWFRNYTSAPFAVGRPK